VVLFVFAGILSVGLLFVTLVHLVPSIKLTLLVSSLVSPMAVVLVFTNLSTGEVSSQARIRSGFKQGILFMVGGGSCAEYHNLKAYGLANDRQMVYACSELVNAKEMVAQLSQC
jgi:hypothetical protein